MCLTLTVAQHFHRFYPVESKQRLGALTCLFHQSLVTQGDQRQALCSGSKLPDGSAESGHAKRPVAETDQLACQLGAGLTRVLPPRPVCPATPSACQVGFAEAFGAAEQDWEASGR